MPAAGSRPFVILLIVLGAATLVVDYPGRWLEGYGPLRHASLDGWGAADLFAPIFIFFLGASIPMTGVKDRRAILDRAALMLGAGIVASGFPRFDASLWRIPGVLQRAALCYVAAASIYRASSGDLRRRGAIVASSGTFLTLVYWLVMTHVPPPGGSAGDLSADRSLAAWIDWLLLRGHLASARWDPDGLLSSVSSISTVLFGTVAGMCFTSGLRPLQKILRLAGAGVAAIAGGLLWTPMFPLSRTLWSSSFVVFTGGIASVLLALWFAITAAGSTRRA